MLHKQWQAVTSAGAPCDGKNKQTLGTALMVMYGPTKKIDEEEQKKAAAKEARAARARAGGVGSIALAGLTRVCSLCSARIKDDTGDLYDQEQRYIRRPRAPRPDHMPMPI